MTEKFLMISLEEEKTKKVVEALSNNTARKILEYLSEKEEASESQIAKEVGIPLSTAHYNIKNLVECQLVESKEFIWSQKGKKIESCFPKIFINGPISSPAFNAHFNKNLLFIGGGIGIAAYMGFIDEIYQ